MLITKKQHEAAIKELHDRHDAAMSKLEENLNAKYKEIFDATCQTLQEYGEQTRGDVAERFKVMQKELEDGAQALFQKALDADRQKRYDSNEPFVEIVSQTFSEEGGVQLRLDWNRPFIEYLKRNGFTGPSDEAIVDNWIVSLSRERIAEGGSEYK